MIQRQAGTSPNKDVAFSAACDHDVPHDVVSSPVATQESDSASSDYYFDNTRMMRSSCTQWQ